jgi:hypothetical protein
LIVQPPIELASIYISVSILGAKMTQSHSAPQERAGGEDMIYGILQERLSKVLELTNALGDEISSESLNLRNANGRSNTIGQQFWCLVGARESYARAFEHGGWRGFSCSLTAQGVHEPDAVRKALADSRDLVQSKLDSLPEAGTDDARVNVLFDLEQHEVQHHGQLIRYFFANALPFPKAFAARYNL